MLRLICVVTIASCATAVQSYAAQEAPRAGAAPRLCVADTASAPSSAATGAAAKITSLEWLGGTWIGSTRNSTFEERWTPPVGGAMQGMARSTRGGRTTSFEFLCIVERGGTLVYQAMPNGRQPATDFTLTKMEGMSVTFENPAHDFPKAVTYTLASGGTLEAVVSGTEKQKPQTFRFRRQSP